MSKLALGSNPTYNIMWFNLVMPVGLGGTIQCKMHFDENVKDLNGRDYWDEPHKARCHKNVYIYKRKILSLYCTSNVNPTL